MVEFNIDLLEDIEVTIKSNRATANRYRQLGYAVPDQLAEFNLFNISPSDLPNKSHTRVSIRCTDCNTVREVTFADRANRCNTCANKITVSALDLTGSNNPNYKDYITDEERAARIEDKRDFRFRRWSFSVKERDMFTCQVCGTTKARFNSHHLNGYKRFPDERYDIDNGVCLCNDCHKRLHSEHGVHTTYKDYIEFKGNN
jgi:rubrerythrin